MKVEAAKERLEAAGFRVGIGPRFLLAYYDSPSGMPAEFEIDADLMEVSEAEISGFIERASPTATGAA